MRLIPRKTLAAASAVALGAGAIVSAAFTPSAMAAGADTTFIVLAPQGGSTAKAAARVAAADGTVVADYSQIGVLVARTTNPDFATAVAGAGVESVASTTGLGSQLDEGVTLETVDAAAQAATGNPTGEPSGACSGTCRRSNCPRRTR